MAAEEGPALSPRKGDEPAFSPRQRLDLTEAEQNLRRERGDAVLLEAYKLQQQRTANRRDILANTIQGWPSTALLGRKIAEWREREAASGRTPALQPAGSLRPGEIPRGATVRIQTADGEVTAKLLSTDRPGGDAMTEAKVFDPRSIKAIDVVDGRDTPSFSPRLAGPDATAPGEATQLQREQHVVRLMEGRRKAKQRAAETGDQIAEARQATNTAPTYGQKEAGNYLKGRVSFHGLPLVMENPEGSIRHGVDADGKPWAAKLPADYGYIARTEGADGDQVDAYIGPDHASQRVWVVDQIDPGTGKFDEHKVMLGFQDLATARDAYHRAFSDGIGPERVGAVTEMPLDEFKAWLQDGDTRSPVGKIKRSGFDADAPPNERGVAFSPRIKDRDLERARKTVDGVVDEVRHGATGGSTESFGTVTRWLEKVAKLHGLDVTGYRHSIDVSAVRHVLRRHTNENIERPRGQVPVTDEDFRLIPEVLAAPDFLVFGEKSGRDHDIIGYIRRLDDGSLLYFEERRSDRQELAALSLRKFAAGTRAADIAGNLGLYARNDGGELTILPVRGRSSALQLPGPGDRPSFSPRKTPDDLEPARQVVDGVAAEMQRGEVATRGVTFGGVTQWLVEKAQAAGLDIAGFRHAIDVSALRHILKRHGDPKVEQSRGQVAVAMADIRRIPDVLVAPDFLVFGDKSRRGLETIGYGKRLPDGSILYFEELRSGRQELSALSLWKYPAGAHASQIRHNLGHHARSDGGSPKIVPAEKGSSALQLLGPSDRPLFSPRATGENRPRQYGIPVDATTITTFKSDEGIKAHRDYKGAKAGDPAAAARLVSALVRPEQLEMARTRFGPDVLYVPVVAEEAAGHNAIPEMLAVYYSEVTGADVARSMRQTVRAFHTGADAMGRLIARPEFEGPVERGRRYVIVDDVSVLGGTLAELANHIHAGGGHVVGVVTLVNAGRSGQYAPRRGHVALIERRFGNEIREAFGVEPSALTADEVQYLVNFKDVDALRARRANAEGEREHRLRQKGVLPSEAQADVREQSVRPDDKPQFSPRVAVDFEALAPTGTSMQGLRHLGTAAYNKLTSTEVHNDPTGQVIKFEGTGRRKTIVGAGEDLLRLVPALPELLRVAVPIGKPEPDARGRPDILAFHKLRATVETDGRTFGVILTVREMRDGTLHYALHKDDGREPGALPGSEDKGEPRSSPLDGAARSAGNIASARPPGKGEGPDGLIIVPHDLPSKPMFSPRSTGENRTHDDTAELRQAYGNAGVPTPKAQRSVVDEARARIEARQRRYDQLDRPRRTDAEAVRPAEATPISERTAPTEGQPLFSPRQDRDTFAAEIMLDLATMDEMFRFPRTKAWTPEAALRDVSPDIQFKGDATRPDEQQESGADRRLMFRTQRGHDFYLYENDGTFWIDVSRLDEGENGSAIYAALMDWAANTDRKFIGDPVHLSNIALRRRTDAMLSSALKHRSTDHMEPHPRQLAGDESLGVPPLVWSHGDTLGNIQNLIDVSSASFLAKVPELKNARFDFDTRTYRTGEGERLSDETFQKWANSLGRDRAAGAGSATLKRAIFLNSLLRAEAGSRPKLQEIGLRGWGEPVRAADRILYSPRVTGGPDRRLAANLQGAEGLPVQRLPPLHNIGERRAGAALVVDTEKDVSNRGDDSFDIVPHDLPRKLVLSPRLNEQDLERAREIIDNVVEARRRGEVGTPAKSFGRATPWLANLARKHGLEVAGYQHAIDVSAIRHIQNRHTNAAIELSRGQAPARPQDLRLIPDILAAPDFLAFGDRTRRGFDTIGYGKKFSDGSLLYFEQRLSSKRTLAAVSLWRYPAGTHADQIKYSLTHHARSDGGAATKVVAVDDQSSALQLPGPDDRPSFSPRFTEVDLVKAAPAHSIGNEERPSGQRSAPIDSTRKPQFSPRQYGIPADAITITTFKSDEGIKAHRDYKEAKAGDPAAAARLVSGLVRPEQVETALAKFGPDTLYVPVVAEEATGHNAIPEFLARYYAEVTGADVARGIRQTVRAFHTGADAMGRLIARPEFEGPVEHGRGYVIVDDVSVLGGTLAELANHIQAGGGHIAGVVTLVNASRSGQYAPRRGHVALIERRFGNEIREAFGVEPSALTADEVQYLVNFKDADALRARRANAESERERRLREKGVLPSEAQAKVRERGVEPDDKPQFSPRQDRRAPGFYSALTCAVENLKVEEMVPDQWRSTIQNLQGVKAAELKWVGLDDWLVERANRPSNGKPSSEKPITKQEILDFLQAHEIQVLEIEKRGGSSTWNIGRFRLSGGKGYRELLLLMPERANDKPYKSDHWTENNVLAHVRFDQRTGSHGERILHLAEVQSDWHQEGRHQGYRWRTIGEIDRERAAVEAKFLRREPGLDMNNSSEIQSALSRSPDLWTRLLELQKERRKLPHSPFEKAWPELTMKRVIGYAAEHGYDRVTWETGATIVKRYHRRGKLGEIHHWSDVDGGIHTVAFDRRGIIILEPRVVEPPDRLTKLSRMYGRDLADRISREEGVASEKYEGASVIPGDGRLIGGEDMFAFYDDMLPNVVRKLGRRFGAEVADSWVENRNGRRIPVHGIDITPEMRQRVIEHGWPYLSPRQVADRPSQRAERNSSAAGRPLEPGMNRGIRIVTGSLEPSDEPERDIEDEQRRVRAMYFDALKRRAAQSLSVME